MKKSLIAALMLLATASPARAVGSSAEVTVYDRAENRALPVYVHDGRNYVVGKPGNEYQVNVRSNRPGEILAVVSVDSINAVSGETANWAQTGYVLGPYASFAIKGWRKSLQRIAAFYFTELENSYAARTARPDNVGVIGVAVFRKKPEPAVGIYRDSEQRREAPPANAGAAEAAKRAPAQGASADAAPLASTIAPQPVEKSLGTGHGRNESSVVRYTSFERMSNTPDEIITIYYDSYRNLVAQGVIRDTPRIARPSAFPNQFVPDPH